MSCSYVGKDVTDPYSFDIKVPSYYKNLLAEKEELANKRAAMIEEDLSEFIFFTDAHWDFNYRHSPELIEHIMLHTGIKDVLYGGDVINNHMDSIEKAMEIGLTFQKAFSFIGGNFYCAYGNHDNNLQNQKKLTDLRLSDEQIYSYLQSQMEGVVYDGYFNFYFDRPECHTRFIFLDTGRYYYKEERGTIHLTMDALVRLLDNTPKGYHIVVVSHEWGSYVQPSGWSISTHLSKFLDVLDDYNAARAGAVKYSSNTVEYDFTERQGKIEYCIGGHFHRDFVGSSKAGIPVVMINTDSRRTPDNEPAVKKTISEQSVSIMVADYDEHKLYIYRVGRGEDQIVALPDTY